MKVKRDGDVGSMKGVVLALAMTLAVPGLSPVTPGPDGSSLHAQEKPTLTEADYGKWERLGPATLSPDGAWLAVQIARVNDEAPHPPDRLGSWWCPTAPRRPSATTAGGWRIGVSEDEREAARAADRPVREKLGLLDLETGEQATRDEVASFAFSADGRYLALRRYKPEDKEGEGVDVIVHDLAEGTDMLFGNVSEMAWQDEGTLLALVTDAADQVGNGVTVYDPTSGRIRTLDNDEAVYRELAWREDADDLVVYRTRVDEAFEDTAHVVLAWKDLESDGPTKLTLDPDDNAAFPATIRVVEHRSPEWSEDGSMVFVGIQERRPKPENA